MSDLPETLLSPVSPENPSGPNLEYDAQFMAFERALQGKPEQQIGSTIVPAQEPDWAEVRRLAIDLLGRSKDLRVAVGLSQSLLRLQGFSGFAEGLALLRGALENFWETLHPQPDPDDPQDFTMRVNALAHLAEPSVLSSVRQAPLVSARGAGLYTLRDLEVAQGEVAPASGTEPPSLQNIEVAVAESDLAVLQTTATATRACFDAAKSIETALAEVMGPDPLPALARLLTLLRKASTFLSARLAQRQPVSTNADGNTASLGLGSAEATEGAPVHSRHLDGEIGSRDDVLRAIDKICRYYAKHEPSSPIPMFLERCQRLVSMTFVDIVRELAPDAVSTVDVLRGARNE